AHVQALRLKAPAIVFVAIYELPVTREFGMRFRLRTFILAALVGFGVLAGLTPSPAASMPGTMPAMAGFAAHGTAADVTPDAIDWPNFPAADRCASVTSATRTFTGINTSIQVKLSVSGASLTAVAYSKNGGSFVSFLAAPPAQVTITISNND